ncbi:efflux RND transporter permease subunit [Magnetococcales bacterium HHB-1]
MSKDKRLTQGGPIAWMAHNRVTPNLLMWICLLGGLLMTSTIKQEVFPAFTLDAINISIVYPGASPSEVEQGIVLAVEEAVRAIDGIEEIDSTAAEGLATTVVTLMPDIDPQQVYQDVQQAVDRITTLPEESEVPQVSIATHRREVVRLILYADVDTQSLRQITELIRNRLLLEKEISQVELIGARDYEIHVETSQKMLRAYGLTIGDMAEVISTQAVERPAGDIQSRGGDILLNVNERRDFASQLDTLPLITTGSGGSIALGEVSQVSEQFESSKTWAKYNDRSAISLAVYRVGEETPVLVSDAVHRVMQEVKLPEGVGYAIHKDRSTIYRQRLELLLKNAFIGLMLVFILLGLFLEFRLAFWVTMGIPTTFLGAFLFLPGFGASINMVSMFAFIISLGIVVDDAIVAGENIHEYRLKGYSALEAAILGAKEVAVPIFFSILTNIVTFLPLMFVPGVMGKIWWVIPVVVSTVFLLSWFEALFILPAHLGASATGEKKQGVRPEKPMGRLLTRFVKRFYKPFLSFCLHYRYVTLALGVALLMVMMAYTASGRLGFTLMPRVESDSAVVTAVLPLGAPREALIAVERRLMDAAMWIKKNHGGKRLVLGSFFSIKENQVEGTLYLTDPKTRPISTGAVTRLWRKRVGEISGLESIRFESDRGGPGRGSSISLGLAHQDLAVLQKSSAALASRLLEFPNVKDVDDGFSPGKSQREMKLKPLAYHLGLTSREIASQIRHAFYGAEALKQLRGLNEVTIRISLTKQERIQAQDLENLMIRTPTGAEVILADVVEITLKRAYTKITRHNGRRVVVVSANVVPRNQATQVLTTLQQEVLPQLLRDYPGLSLEMRGRQADRRASMLSLKNNFILALLMIYILLAIPFRSYLQPIVVMLAIPFGFVGAVFGHLIMGYSLSVISMMGMIALSGVVINDALVMVDFANRLQRSGIDAMSAILQAGVRRFRPILLTTLTTFGGLAPMIFETSRQARFLIPMAISLGYGLLFATMITLILVPCLYGVFEDVRRGMLLGKAWFRE